MKGDGTDGDLEMTDNVQIPSEKGRAGDIRPEPSSDPQVTVEDEGGKGVSAAAGNERAVRPAKLDSSEEGETAEGRKASSEMEEDEEDLEEDDLDEKDESLGHDDPLGTAYDLEKGAPLLEADTSRRGAKFPWRTMVASAKEFFSTEILYRFDILEVEEREELVGRYRVELKGFNGGVWTVVVGDEVEVSNRRQDADIVLIMDHRDFLHIANGNLNPQLAILSKKMRVVGDVRKAVLFERLLAPSME